MTELKFKTSWDLSTLFSSDTDPEIESSRRIVEEEASKFVAKWQKRKDYLMRFQRRHCHTAGLLIAVLSSYVMWDNQRLRIAFMRTGADFASQS